MLSKLRVIRSRANGSSSKGRLARIAIVLVLCGCSGAEGPNRGARPSHDVVPKSSEIPRSSILPELRLQADLSERSAKWRLIASIPFGPRREELGYSFNPRRGSLPWLPLSFAVAGDGSLWILDVVKKRVAHFSKSGEFIEEAGGLELDRFHPRPKDMAVVGGRMYVTEDKWARTTLTTIGRGGRLHRESIKDGSHPVAVSHLLPSLGRLFARIGGYADPPGSGPTGYGELPVRDRLRLLPGVPVRDDGWVDIQAPGDQDLEFVSARGDTTTTLPIRISVRAGTPSKKLRALVGPGIETVFDRAVGIYVLVAPSRPSEAERFGGGAWYLRLGVDRSPLVWERVPQSSLSAELQFRHLAAGPDDRVYLMVPDRDGEKIYVRPK